MGQYDNVMIELNIEKSDEAMKFAEIAIKENGVRTALNRMYYAIFYTVCALAYKHSYTTSNHKSLIGWFNKKFVHTDTIFDAKLSKIFYNAFHLRQESDYGPKDLPSNEEINILLSDAKLFIETVRKSIGK